MSGDPAAYTIVPVTTAEAEAFLEVDQAAFFFEQAQPVDIALSSLDLSRCYAATRNGGPPFAGVYGSHDMTVTIPAPGGDLRPVPMAGLTWVGVHPDERRRGLLTRMVRHHLQDMHRQGVAVGGLHASEPAIYGRFGYAVASVEARLGLSRGAALTAPGLDDQAASVRTRLTWVDDPETAGLVHDLHVRLLGTQLGAVVRTEAMTRANARDWLPYRREREANRVLFAERDGEAVGYALLNRASKWEDGSPRGALVCYELAAEDSGALLALARRLVDFDLIATVTVEGRSLDDPVLWWAGGPRAAEVRVFDGVWLRLIDVGAAMAQRGYTIAVDVVLDVADPFCPWNEGRWRLRCEGPGSAATCERTDDAADLCLPVQVLASAYCGLRSVASQARQGAVHELTPGAVAALTTAMATADHPVAAVAF